MSMKLSSEKKYLVLENLKLVDYIVRRFGVTPNSSEYENIISIGTIGLIKAAMDFDPSMKIKFSTYASRCIKGKIFNHYLDMEILMTLSKISEIVEKVKDSLL